MGLLGFPWHYGITYIAARKSGYGIMESSKLGWGSVTADFGTQGKGWEITRQHAMAGKLSEGVWQTSEEAIIATKEFIQDNISKKELSKAVHAAQDLATPGHAGKIWDGFGLNMDTIKHLSGDTFPSLKTIRQAYSNTKKVFKCSKG
jgi:hypothetical protein